MAAVAPGQGPSGLPSQLLPALLSFVLCQGTAGVLDCPAQPDPPPPPPFYPLSPLKPPPPHLPPPPA